MYFSRSGPELPSKDRGELNLTKGPVWAHLGTDLRRAPGIYRGRTSAVCFLQRLAHFTGVFVGRWEHNKSCLPLQGWCCGLSLPRGSEQLRPAMSPESSASDSRSPTPPFFPQQGDLRPRAPPPALRAGDQEGWGCSHSPAPAEPLHLCPGALFPPVSQT